MEGQPARQKNSVKTLSHKLSSALRHKAIDLGLHMKSDGFVPVDDLLAHSSFKRFSLAEIQEVVRSCNKQRFKLQDKPAANYGGKPNESILCIRANQGHSISLVDSELLLHRLSSDQLADLPVIVHGTYKAAWAKIQKEGLKRMGRNHIHFSVGLPGDNAVISGMRRTCEVFIYVDANKCAKNGLVFYRSSNGVILTNGVEGTLLVDFFSRVTDARGNELAL